MPLDLATLFFASAISRCAYLVVFLVTALRQPGERCLQHWIGALVSSMIGSFILARIPPTDDLDLATAVTCYVFFSASLSLSWSGLRLFYGREVGARLLGALTFGPALFYAAALGLGVPGHVAVGGVFALCMILSGLCVAEIARAPKEERLWSQYVVGAAFACYFLIFLVSIVTTVAAELDTRTVESGRMSMIIDQVTGILIYFGYLAMAGERASLGLRRLAEIDPLTGLLNRRGLEADGRSRFSLSPPEAAAGMLLADIDHFKSINDAHGHQAGDAVLTAFSARLKAALRAEDVAVRWGGEEFLAILPGAGIDTVATVAERLRAAVEAEPFEIATGSIGVTVSIGITELGRDEHDFEPATRRADAALYAAKSSGRNRIGRSEDAPRAAAPAGPEVPAVLAS